MQRDLTLAFFVVVLGASGAYLLLPHRHGAVKPRNVHAAGAVLAGVALLLFALFLKAPGELFSGLFFYLFTFGALASAVLTVTARNPIHCALWFAAVVLATCGLFLLAGAQFLAAGTVIVYAGAIIVTFLFVIMLAQMEGRAAYDRSARTPFRATWTCFVLFFGVLWALFHVNHTPVTEGGSDAPAPYSSRFFRAGALEGQARPGAAAGVREVLARANRPTAQLADARGHEKPHVAGLGETLYTDHLVTVELAGALLFAALIGAIAVATPKPPTRPADRRLVEPGLN